jgi:hypothetical protein
MIFMTTAEIIPKGRRAEETGTATIAIIAKEGTGAKAFMRNPGGCTGRSTALIPVGETTELILISIQATAAGAT